MQSSENVRETYAKYRRTGLVEKAKAYIDIQPSMSKVQRTARFMKANEEEIKNIEKVNEDENKPKGKGKQRAKPYEKRNVNREALKSFRDILTQVIKGGETEKKSIREEAAKEKQALIEEMTICQICYQNRKNRTFVPCGHMLCESCASRIRENEKCAFCRSHILIMVKSFI